MQNGQGKANGGFSAVVGEFICTIKLFAYIFRYTMIEFRLCIRLLVFHSIGNPLWKYFMSVKL